MANTVLDNLNAAKELYSSLLISVGLAMQNPTQANIAAAVADINAGSYTGTFLPKLNYSLDGESYQWQSYFQWLTDALAKINALIQAESMPFVVTSRARA